MPQSNDLHDHFKFSYRADCTNCEKYVGPKRTTKQAADADKQAHINEPANHDHVVKIEVTQSFHIV
jgi:hypothetical protein